MTHDQIMLAVASLSLGITAKYADLFNEHGLPVFFKYADTIFGILWGISGIAMIYYSPYGGLTYVAHVLYWFNRVKLEYFNHALAGVMMLLAGFYYQGNFLHEHRNELLLIYLAYLVTGLIHTYFKVNYPKTQWFLRLRFRIYLIPIIYAIYIDNIDPIIATGFGMIGCELITNLYRKYAADIR